MNRIDRCILCADARLARLFSSRHEWLVRCRGCGLAFADRRPSPHELAAYYQTYPTRSVLSPITEKRYDELLNAFESARRTNRLIDFGAGNGHFAERASKHGWQTFVEEVSEERRAALVDRGLLPLDRGHLAEHAASFDVVVAHEVIEHMSDPTDLPAVAAALLRPGGVFYLTTPNIDGFSRRLCSSDWRVIEFPEHLNYFSPKTLRQLLSARGFTVEWSATTGIDLAGIRRWRSGAATASSPPSEPPIESVRESLEHGPAALAKRAANALLSLLALGDTIKMLARRT